MFTRLRLTTLFSLVLFIVIAVPLQAAKTDEGVMALEKKLMQLKTDQQQLKKEQSVLKNVDENGLAKIASRPKFIYRPGGGLSIRPADRSWEIRWGATWQVQTSFFPGGPKADQDEDDEGPSEGATIMRRIDFDFSYLWEKGFYQIGATMNYSGAGTHKKNLFSSLS